MGFFSKDNSKSIDSVTNLIDKTFTSDEERLNAHNVLEKIELAKQTLQTDQNKIESQSRSIFIAGWRPAIGWVCAAGLSWYYVAYPMAVFILAIVAPDINPADKGDAESLFSLVFTLLGLGGYRTFEKIKGKAK